MILAFNIQENFSKEWSWLYANSVDDAAQQLKFLKRLRTR